MTTTIYTFIRTLGVAALLALTVVSVSATTVHAKNCKNPYRGGTQLTWRPGDIVYQFETKSGSWTTSICDDDGSWIVFKDEELDAGTQPPPPPVFPFHVAALPVGGVLSPR